MNHDCVWVEKERFYAPPAWGFRSDRIPSKLARELMMGVTTITLRCNSCGDLKTLEILGKHQISQQEVDG